MEAMKRSRSGWRQSAGGVNEEVQQDQATNDGTDDLTQQQTVRLRKFCGTQPVLHQQPVHMFGHQQPVLRSAFARIQ